jgi:hypothetical protein
MNKIGPGIAKIQRKTSRKHFCLSIPAVMYRTDAYARQLSRAIKRRPHVLACISAIPGRILVIFSILKIPLEFSISFILLNVLHGHCRKSYSNFNLQLPSSEYYIKFQYKNGSLNSSQILKINTNIDFSASLS